jgi:3-phenylpropionate/trans-cinnamate dioxygenase ferredoxin subunit
MTKHFVARVDEIPPGGRQLVKVAGRTIGVFNIAGGFYAIKNSCIHEGAPVCLGAITGTFLPSEPGEYEYGLEGQVLRCPWHGWEFDITTGGSIFDPAVKLKTYPLTVEDDAVFIEL